MKFFSDQGAKKGKLDPKPLSSWNPSGWENWKWEIQKIDQKTHPVQINEGRQGKF